MFSGVMRLHDFLDYWARRTPDAEFAILGPRRITYAEAQAELYRVANALVAAGLAAGDRVAVLSKNSIEYVVLYYAAARVGVVPVPLNYRLAPPEWAWIVQDAGARLLLASGEFLKAIDDVRGALGSVERFVAIDAPPSDGWQAYRDWLAAQPPTPPAREVDEEQVLYQMYTSGTTGRPKGALLTHRAITANLAQFMVTIEPAFGERWLLVVPMYHASGAVTSFAAIQGGGCLYLQQDFNPAAVVRALSEEHIGRTSLVPAMIQACLVMVPDVAECRYDRLRLIAYGASPIAEATLRRAMAVFGCDFVQAYGMTETSAVLTYLLPGDHRRALTEKPGLLLSAGRPVVGVDLRIVDEDDAPVPCGTIGEIVARGPQLMQGYWNNPEESRAALRGGFMHTGDAGVMDEEGFVYIQDRVKDMIVSGGENIYPRMIEEVLFTHPAIADAAAIGVPHDTWGETVKAVVVLRAGATATQEEIIDFCRGKLGGFERPRSVDIVTELPRTPTGKVLKRVLREPYWTGHRRRVAGS
jgi:acyl-CoA synthetase (AMP-forming)/AMP-acid ligase II